MRNNAFKNPRRLGFAVVLGLFVIVVAMVIGFGLIINFVQQSRLDQERERLIDSGGAVDENALNTRYPKIEIF